MTTVRLVVAFPVSKLFQLPMSLAVVESTPKSSASAAQLATTDDDNNDDDDKMAADEAERKSKARVDAVASRSVVMQSLEGICAAQNIDCANRLICRFTICCAPQRRSTRSRRRSAS